MRKRLVAQIVLLLTAAAALEVIFVPLDPVLASPPNTPNQTTCLAFQTGRATPQRCSFTASYYRGGGSLAYCFLGEGALYIHGVYYPFTQPGASANRVLGNAFCPSMHR